MAPRDQKISKYKVDIALVISPQNQYGDNLPDQTRLTIESTYTAHSLTELARLLEYLEKLPKNGDSQ